ncbi:AMP-binding protein [Bradyrhizobium sp. 33ap4]|uniref:AMP-binding protein n=1 Tax=Bradyrhizobium sp. 33ap4 TaxID=3061630 RepID=UPI0029307AD7|nr:AMP-binding protein [Bradyrhizobium sp. 33ap4]
MVEDQLHTSTTYASTLIKALSRYPDRIALVQDDQRLSYRELASQISQLMQAFEQRGLHAGDGIAQLSRNSIAAASVQLAAFAMGLRYTPLHPLGSREDHAHILADSESAALIFDSAHFLQHVKTMLEQAAPEMTLFSHLKCELGEDLFALASSFEPRPLSTLSKPTDIVALLYTGGTTGRPKGVALSSSAMVMNVLLTLSEWEWPEEIRFLCSTPITHATGCMLIPVLLRGGTVVLQDGFKAERFAQAVKAEKITATFLVPTMIYVLLDEAAKRSFDLSSLQVIIYGGSPISPKRLQEAITVFGPKFMQIYSQSEAPNCASILRRSEHTRSDLVRLSCCGRPLAGIEVAILDNDDQPVPSGQVGEVCFRGPSIMRGYWKRPDESGETLRNGWLHTGDMAHQDSDGFLYIVDRKKEMIITGGFNVFPREIEDVLMEHPSVASATVVGVPDSKWGEAVKALVVSRDGAAIDEAELVAYVKARKGSIAAPKSIECVDAIPLTAVGKPDRKAVRARFWSDQSRQVG